MIFRHKTNLDISIYGYQEWHKNGNLHRIDGPAIIWADGDARFYRYNIRISRFLNVEEEINKLKFFLEF